MKRVEANPLWTRGADGACSAEIYSPAPAGTAKPWEQLSRYGFVIDAVASPIRPLSAAASSKKKISITMCGSKRIWLW